MYLSFMKYNIVIYDDNASRRESLQMLLESYEHLSVIGNFANCHNLKEQMAQLNPHVVLMDIQMPGISGIEAVQIINKNYPNVRVIMQTVFEDEEKIFDALRFGAGGYILKKDNPEKIISAIEDIMNGGAPMTPVIANKVLQYFRQKSSPESHDYGLTDREKMVLKALVEGKSYKMIAEIMNISYHTVNSHVRKIYEKLQVHSAGEAVNKALTQNIV